VGQLEKLDQPVQLAQLEQLVQILQSQGQKVLEVPQEKLVQRAQLLQFQDRRVKLDLKDQPELILQCQALRVLKGHKVPQECPQIHSAHFYLSSTKMCFLADKNI
jgi:hypothetical protein